MNNKITDFGFEDIIDDSRFGWGKKLGVFWRRPPHMERSNRKCIDGHGGKENSAPRPKVRMGSVKGREKKGEKGKEKRGKEKNKWKIDFGK